MLVISIDRSLLVCGGTIAAVGGNFEFKIPLFWVAAIFLTMILSIMFIYWVFLDILKPAIQTLRKKRFMTQIFRVSGFNSPCGKKRSLAGNQSDFFAIKFC